MRLVAADERCFAQVAERHDQSGQSGGVREGDHARHVAERTVEAELAAERQALGAVGADLAGGDEEADGDGQIEAGAAFTNARWVQQYILVTARVLVMTTRAAIYARISSDRDETRVGVEDQECQCRRLCADRGWEVIEPPYVDNDISAADPRKKRPEYDRLLADVKAGKVGAVVVAAEDRLHRRPHELEGFVSACDAAGLTKLASVGGDTNLNDPDALMLLRIKGAMAAREVDVTRRRILNRKRDIAERGGTSGGGTRPFGYEPGGMVVREEEAAEIRKAVQHLLGGGSIYAIRHDWMDRDVESVTQLKKHGETYWSTQAVRKILTSPRIAGLRQHRGEVIGQAQWPAIVTEDDWRSVCTLLDNPSRRQPPPSREYPLRGVLTCAECGDKLAAMPRGSGPNATRYYGCRKDGGGCGTVFITSQLVEDYVVGKLVPMAEAPSTLASLQAEDEAAAQELRTLVDQKSADEAALQQLEDKALEDELRPPVERRFDPRTYDRRRRTIRQQIAAAETRIADLRGSSALGRLGPSLAESWPTLSADEQRSVFLALVHEIKVGKRERKGGNKFDPSRIKFNWRWGALATLAEEQWERMSEFERAQAERDFERANDEARREWEEEERRKQLEWETGTAHDEHGNRLTLTIVDGG
jgi:DNA invertase Pin-like site-specific DNA recombinase